MSQKPNADSKSPSIAWRFYALIALALVGLGISIYLTNHFYEIRMGGSSFKSICNLGGKMDCDAVAASRYAELGLGIPLSSFSAGWFLALIGIYLFGLSMEWRKEAIRFATFMNGFSAAMSVIYLFIMFQIIGSYCLFCFIVDGVTFVSFAVNLSMGSPFSKAQSTDRSQWKIFAMVVAGCLFVSIVALKGLDQANLKSSDIDWQVQDVLNKLPLPVHADPKYPAFGPATAPITVVEFSDFECPFCRLGALTINTLVHLYPTQLRVVFRNFPLDISCNSKMKQPLHHASCEAARAAYCANQQGKFGPLYETMFERQTSLEPGKPVEMAKELGLDTAKLEACMNSQETQLAIQADIEEGSSLGVTSTPTFFINGRKVEGVIPVPAWNKLIDILTKK